MPGVSFFGEGKRKGNDRSFNVLKKQNFLFRISPSKEGRFSHCNRFRVSHYKTLVTASLRPSALDLGFSALCQPPPPSAFIILNNSAPKSSHGGAGPHSSLFCFPLTIRSFLSFIFLFFTLIHCRFLCLFVFRPRRRF